ncbi:MAG: ABC transporter permease [Oscillospiraceae bacterium]|nr:ABC transporter permease [Oscillospiraceae bacterium]
MSTAKERKRDPLLRVSKRDEGIPGWRAWGIRLIGLLLALIVSAIVIYAIVRLNPLSVYKTMWKGAFGTNKRTWVTIRDMMTLLCIACALAPAFAMRFWNIGAEGQVLVGGIATAACMIYCPGLPMPLLFLIMIVTSIVAGGIWGLIPGFFKAHWNTNETLFTLMMNYIAIQLTSFFVAKWENPYGSNSVGVINSQTKAGWLPNLFSSGYNADFGWNVIIVLLIATLVFFYLRETKHGYEISVVGDSENTARYAGVRVKRVYVRTMALSGAIAGLAGFLAVSGASHTISVQTAGGRGFTAIIVAWLSRMNTYVMLIFAALLVFLEKGATEIASTYGLNEYVSQIIEGIILFFVLGSEFFVNYKVKRRGKN